MYSGTFFKILYKTVKEFISSNVANLFYSKSEIRSYPCVFAVFGQRTFLNLHLQKLLAK